MPMINPRLPFIRSCIVAILSLSSCPALYRTSKPRRPPVGQDVDGRDKPGRDGNRKYSACGQDHASIRLKTSVALVPPKPKEFDITVPIRALSMRLRTIGMSAKTG